MANEPARALLGRPGRATFFKWKKGELKKVPHDTVRRISYLLGIWKALQILLPRSNSRRRLGPEAERPLRRSECPGSHARRRRDRPRRGPRAPRRHAGRASLTAWPPLRRVRGPAPGVSIPGRYPPIQLFERIADPVDWEALADVEALTNPRIRDEIGEISLIAARRAHRGSGASWVMGSFVHIGRPSRFSDGSYGVYYAARHRDTAVAETCHHLALFYGATAETALDLEMRVLVGPVDATFHDLRGETGPVTSLLDPCELHREPALRPGSARRRQQRRRLPERAPRTGPVPRRLPPPRGPSPRGSRLPPLSLGRWALRPLLRLCRRAVGCAARLRRKTRRAHGIWHPRRQHHAPGRPRECGQSERGTVCPSRVDGAEMWTI